MQLHYIRAIWRSLWKNKITSFINLFGLAAGMTAAIFIFMWVQNETTFDNYHPNAHHIYRATGHIYISPDETWLWERTPLPLANTAKSEIPGVENTARLFPLTYGSITTSVKGNLFAEKSCAYVDSGWFQLFHYDFIAGNETAFQGNPHSVILTADKAKKYFGSQDAIGQTVKIDTVDYKVTGVIRNNPVNSSFQYDILMPLASRISGLGKYNDWNDFDYISFLQLDEKTSPAVVAQKLTAIAWNDPKEKNHSFITLQPLQEMHFEQGIQNSSIIHTDRKTVYIVSIMALLLLLTACINYVNLTTARASLRAKEVSLRKIVGARVPQLFGRFMAESLLTSAMALLLSLLLIWLLLPFFNRLTETRFGMPLYSFEMWRILLGTLLAATLLNGIYPALILSSFKPLNVLRGINVLKMKDAFLRKTLVVVQFSIAVVLITGTIVVYRQMQYAQNSAGYQRAQVIQLNLPLYLYRSMQYDANKMSSFIQSFRQDLLQQSSISHVAVCSASPVNLQDRHGGWDWDGRSPDNHASLAELKAQPNFNQVFRLQMAAGRWFSESNQADVHNYILNETAVKELNIHQPVIGQRLSHNNDSGQIIGVVKDFHYRSIHEKIEPLIISCMANGNGDLFVESAPGNVRKAIQTIEACWKKRLPNYPPDYVFLDETFNNLYKQDRKVSQLTLVFACIAIVIAALGLFGLAAFTTEQRVKEIGIRKVLGATVQQIAALLSKDFVRLVAIAILLATPVAWWLMHTWLNDFAYRIRLSPWIFAGAGLLAILIALVSVGSQSIKAALSNPVKSLRSE